MRMILRHADIGCAIDYESFWYEINSEGFYIHSYLFRNIITVVVKDKYLSSDVISLLNNGKWAWGNRYLPCHGAVSITNYCIFDAPSIKE